VKNAVFCDVAPCRSCVNCHFGGTYRLHFQSRKIGEQGTNVSRWPPTNPGSSLADFSTLKMEAIRTSETSVHTRSTLRYIPEHDILHSDRRENLESYKLVSFHMMRLTDFWRQSFKLHASLLYSKNFKVNLVDIEPRTSLLFVQKLPLVITVFILIGL
jgi:hypothetical protein